jgi:branched-chain amino acid transport system permease protein
MFWQQAVNAIALGAVYAVFAVGYTLIFGVLKVLNLAHAAIYMVGAFLTLYFLNAGLHLSIALLVAMALSGGLGALLYLLVFKPIGKRKVSLQDKELLMLIVSLAASSIIISVVQMIVGVDVMRFPPDTFVERMIQVGSLSISVLQMTILAVSIVLMLLLRFFTLFTQTGRAMRAVAENDRTAGLLGINVERIVMLTFFVSSALGAASGVLISLQTNSLWVHMGGIVELKALSIIILGGLGSISGAFLAAILIGFIDVFSTAYISSLWKDAIIFGLLFATLIVRPTGLLGTTQNRRV